MWARIKGHGLRPSPATVMAFLALVFAMGGFAMAASVPDKNGVIHVCYKSSGSKKGLLRVTKKDKCSKGEKKLAFNQKGSRGAQGQAGPAGSDAQFNGAQAGGALTGTYPSPSLAPPESVHLVGASGEPAFESGASNSGGSLPAGFYKDGFGVVHLQGTVNVGAGADVFRLPAGYRPADQVCVSAPAFDATNTTFFTNRVCVIASTGEVRNSNGSGVHFISLDGLSLRPTQ